MDECINERGCLAPQACDEADDCLNARENKILGLSATRLSKQERDELLYTKRQVLVDCSVVAACRVHLEKLLGRWPETQTSLDELDKLGQTISEYGSVVDERLSPE